MNYSIQFPFTLFIDMYLLVSITFANIKIFGFHLPELSNFENQNWTWLKAFTL
jgi:hypothetical protein